MKTVLLVEDDPIDVMLVLRTFKRMKLDADVRVVHDGDAAVRYLGALEEFGNRNQNPLPYVVVLDLNLPRRSGFEVLQWIRQQSPYKHLPVVVLTSSSRDVDMRNAYNAGANSYLVKSPDQDELNRMATALHNYWLEFNRQPEFEQ
jgi:CheY-like chemotaxis protein